MKSSYYFFLLSVSFFFYFQPAISSGQESDTVLVVLKLASIDDLLSFNQAHVPVNGLEYKWSVVVDSDDDPTTGNGAGFDVEISLSHFKPSGGVPFTASILEGTQHNTFVLSGSSGSYGHALQAVFHPADTSIYLKGLKAWPELAGIDEGDPFKGRAYFNAPSGAVEDQTAVQILPADITDPEGDVVYSFIDLKRVRISDISSAAVWLPEDQFQFDIYPNPAREFVIIDYQLPPGVYRAEVVIQGLGGQTLSIYPIDDGAGTIRIAAFDWAPGTYFGVLMTKEGRSQARKMIVVK